MTKDDFIDRARQRHGDKYDYSKVNYINTNTKVCIICPIHGEFWQRPINHYKKGHGCSKCSQKHKYTTEEWIDKAKETCGDIYDWSKVKYANNHIKVTLICKIHGEFNMRPNDLLNGQRCPLCSKKQLIESLSSNKNEFITKANQTHNNAYDYSKVDYINNRTKVCIICPKHGEFWQTPHSHLSGQGCPKCSRSLMEEYVAKYFDSKNIEYEQQKTFEWLKNKQNLRLDFYLDKYNVAIECQGRQHYESIEGFGGFKNLLYTQANDKLKYELCEMNGVKIYYIKYNEKMDDKLIQILNDIKYVQDTVQK